MWVCIVTIVYCYVCIGGYGIVVGYGIGIRCVVVIGGGYGIVICVGDIGIGVYGIVIGYGIGIGQVIVIGGGYGIAIAVVIYITEWMGDQWVINERERIIRCRVVVWYGNGRGIREYRGGMYGRCGAGRGGGGMW